MAFISQIKLSDTTYDISAIKLKNARTLTIGNTGKSFDGTANVSWTRDEIGCSYGHYADWDFTKAYASNYVTFDKSKAAGAPEGTSWLNGFVSTYNNYLSSFIVNEHRTTNWYVGYSEHNTTTDVNPTWYKLIHSGNLTVSNTIANGTTSGPTIKTTVSGVSGSPVTLPSASSSISGVVTTGTQSFKGVKTFDSETYMSSFLGIQHRNVTKGTLPSSVQYWTLNNCDVNGSAYTNALGQFETALNTDGLTKTYIRARQFVANTASSIATATLSVQVDINGNMRADCNAPLYGAVWNDYAEFRICNEGFKPGQVVLENGDDTLSIASQRLQRGCSIVSDTFGFAIGETDEAKCPIAVSGRVLAYGYESREEFKKHIGWPVCSGPNGTVSIMTEEEEEKYPSRIIGTISAVPNYETWGAGNVEVNNRIWIKIK